MLWGATMKQVHEYFIPTNRKETVLLMPEDAEVLGVQAPFGEVVYFNIYLAALIDPAEPAIVKRTFLLISSDSDMPDGVIAYVGTVSSGKTNYGRLDSIHVFEVQNTEGVTP